MRCFAAGKADRDTLGTMFRVSMTALCDKGDTPMTPVCGVYTFALAEMPDGCADADYARQEERRSRIE